MGACEYDIPLIGGGAWLKCSILHISAITDQGVHKIRKLYGRHIQMNPERRWNSDAKAAQIIGQHAKGIMAVEE